MKKTKKKKTEPTEQEINQMIDDGFFDKYIQEKIERDVGFKIDWDMTSSISKKGKARQKKTKRKGV